MYTYLPKELIRYILQFNQDWWILFGYYFINTEKLSQIPRPISFQKNGITTSRLLLPIMNEKSYSLVYNDINFVVAIDTITPISIELCDFFYSTDRKTWKPHHMCVSLLKNN